MTLSACKIRQRVKIFLLHPLLCSVGRSFLCYMASVFVGATNGSRIGNILFQSQPWMLLLMASTTVGNQASLCCLKKKNHLPQFSSTVSKSVVPDTIKCLISVFMQQTRHFYDRIEKIVERIRSFCYITASNSHTKYIFELIKGDSAIKYLHWSILL